jgi:hypothetical protein
LPGWSIWLTFTAGLEGFAEAGVLDAEELDLGGGELEVAGQRAVGAVEPGAAGGQDHLTQTRWVGAEDRGPRRDIATPAGFMHGATPAGYSSMWHKR